MRASSGGIVSAVSSKPISANMYPYEAGATGLSSCFPPWAHEGGLRETLSRLRDDGQRARIRDARAETDLIDALQHGSRRDSMLEIERHLELTTAFRLLDAALHRSSR